MKDKKRKIHSPLERKALILTVLIAVVILTMSSLLIRYAVTSIVVFDRQELLAALVSTSIDEEDEELVVDLLEEGIEKYQSISSELDMTGEKEQPVLYYLDIYLGDSNKEKWDKVKHKLDQVKEKFDGNMLEIGLAVYDAKNERLITLSSEPNGSENYLKMIYIKDKFTLLGSTYYYSCAWKSKDESGRNIIDMFIWSSYVGNIDTEDNFSIDLLGSDDIMGVIYVDEKSAGTEDIANVLTAIFALPFTLFIIVIQFALSRFLRYLITKPILKISAAAKNFSKSENISGEERFFDKLDIKTNDELSDLSDTMKNMEVVLHEYMDNLEDLTRKEQRIATEIEVAARVQANMLPERTKELENAYYIASYMHPARVVGGDFYDYFDIDDDRVAVIIADVSDKGIPAAMFMVVARTIIKNNIQSNPDDIAQAIVNANKQLCNNNKDMMFVTVFACVYSISSRKMWYINAGHNDPAVYRALDKEYTYSYEEHDIFLGVMDDLTFVSREIEFSKGDKLFIYTDGITEAMDESDNEFGPERLLESLNSSSMKTAEEAMDGVWNDLIDFRKEAVQSDDITMVLFEVK